MSNFKVFLAVAALFSCCFSVTGSLSRSAKFFSMLPKLETMGASQLSRVPFSQKFATTGEQIHMNPALPHRFPQRGDSPDLGWQKPPFFNEHNSAASISAVDIHQILIEQQLIKMDYPELLEMVEAKNEFSAAAADIVRKQTGHLAILISNSHLLPIQKSEMFIDGSRFVICSTSKALSYLKNFGRNIWSLEIELWHGEKKDAKKIMKYVDKFCSKSLVELGMTVDDGKIPLSFRNPFLNVQKLSLINLSTKEPSKLPTNQQFPSLQSLHLEVRAFETTSPLQFFSQLNELHAVIYNENTEQVVKNLTEVNPNLQSLTLVNTSSAFLRTIAAKAPKLASLNVVTMQSDGLPIRFENLLQFTTPRDSCNLSEFDLPNLRMFDVFHEAMPPHELNEFLQKHRNLTHFHVTHRSMFDSEFENITSQLPELIEVSVIDTTLSAMNMNTMITILDSHPKLLEFYVNECNQDDKHILRKKYGSKWQIEDYENGLSFIRNKKSMFNKLLTKIGLR